jgi:uncharacterized protein (TIGR00266 family)
MKVDIQCAPAYALAYCYLEADEYLKAEPGAMTAMSGGIQVQATAGPGGVTKGLMRKAFANESFFMTRYTSRVHGGWVALSPRYPGDIAVIDIHPDRPLLAEQGSFLAVSQGLEVDVRLGNLGTIAMREGATLQKIHGEGTALLCSYGGIQRFGLAGGQQIVVDTGHLVAFTQGMGFTVGPLSGLVTAKLSGEGLVAQLTGPGEVYIQTRAEDQLQSWLMPKRLQNQR